jgi:VIT1/CCC1 family predicted Fe2+/Mn2+ transporter
MIDDAKRLRRFRDHLQGEVDSAWLYDALARVEPDEPRRALFERLAAVERKHVDVWRGLLADAGVDPGDRGPSLRARAMAAIAARFGPSAILSALVREEAREVAGYLALSKGGLGTAVTGAAQRLARESSEHADELRKLTGRAGEAWHRTESGGFLRNVVYGFNDGLTANFGLVAGIVGAQAGTHVVLVAGIAGTIADALSMGASGYLAAKSEREVYEHEIAIERDEIQLMPDVEEEEMALLYEMRGIAPPTARRMAAELMRDPERALEEKTRDELGIAPAHASPLREGWITGCATAVGALIPVAPFLVWDGATAIVVSFAVSMLSHFGVGAGRSWFTGRGVLRSGADMIAVGLGVSIVGYVVGEVVSQLLLG